MPARLRPAVLAGDGAGHLDLPRAVRGGFAGGCFAVFTCCPSDEEFESEAYFAAVDQPRALAEALAQVALLLRLERESGGQLRIARAPDELDGEVACGNWRRVLEATWGGRTRTAQTRPASRAAASAASSWRSTRSSPRSQKPGSVRSMPTIRPSSSGGLEPPADSSSR